MKKLILTLIATFIFSTLALADDKENKMDTTNEMSKETTTENAPSEHKMEHNKKMKKTIKTKKKSHKMESGEPEHEQHKSE